MRNLTSTELKRLHREWRRRTPASLAIALDGVAGPFNVGGIIRSAAAYRVETLWLCGDATGPENPKVAKTALGTDRYLDVIRVASVDDAAAAARGSGRKVVGIELSDAALPLHELDLRGNVCMVIGHEDRGLSRTGLAACDTLGFVPQLGRVGSLNVTAAASIAMYEWARQQWG